VTAARRPIAVGAALLALAGCAAPASEAPEAADRPWEDVLAEADGQTVDLWMYGGEEAGNAYVDGVLAPAAAELG
jgi:putative spermidine/putrescine transport system substrate-binding protein